MNVDSPSSPARAAMPSPPPRDAAGSAGAGSSGAGPAHSLQAPPGLVRRTVPGEASAGPSAPRTLIRPGSPPAGSPAPAAPSGTADVTAQPDAPPAEPPAEPPAAQRLGRGQPPLNHERVGRLVQAQALLEAGYSYGDTRQVASADSRVVSDMFDKTGRLRLTARAEALLNWKEPEMVAGLRELPRALAKSDALILAHVLRQNAAQAWPDLRQAAADNGVQAVALDHLFDPQGRLRDDRVAALPAAQRQMLRSAGIPGDAASQASSSRAADEAPVDRSTAAARQAAFLVDAHARIAAGEQLNDVAGQAGVPPHWLKMIDRRGCLVLGAQAERLLHFPELEQAEQLAAMPRSLRYVDLHRLKHVLTQHTGQPQADLRAAGTAASIWPEALAYLLDDQGRLRRDRVATLPPDQQQTLFPGAAVAPVPAAPAAQASTEARVAHESAEVQRATGMAEAQAMLAAGQTRAQAAAHANCVVSTLSHSFDAQGRLLFTRHAEHWLNGADANLAARFAAMPRALRRVDVDTLQRLLSQHAGEPNADLKQAGVAAGVAPQALAYLLDADGQLRADRVATLPDDQRQILQTAVAGTSATASPSHEALAGPSTAGSAPAEPSAPADRPVPAVAAPVPAMASPAAVAAQALAAVEAAAIQRAQSFLQAQALLATGMSRPLVAQQVGISVTMLSKVFNARGRLLFTPQAERLMNGPDLAVAASFATLPRAIREGEMRPLDRLLWQHRRAPLPDLREACAAAGIAPQTLAYLFDADGQLRSDGFAALPRDQQEMLQKAHGTGGGAPTAAPDAAASTSRPTAGPAASTSRPPSGSGASTSRPVPHPGPSTSRPGPPATRGAAPRPMLGTAVRPSAASPTVGAREVLQFFRQHRHPDQAFSEAKARFNLTRERLVQLLASAGVTELEGRSGRLPDAMTMWQRVRGGGAPITGAPSAPQWAATSATAATATAATATTTATTSAAVPTPSIDLDFAASLEDQLQFATPTAASTPAPTPSSAGDEFAAALEDILQSATPSSAATPSVLGKRPAPDTATSPETLPWDAQGAMQRPRPAAQAAAASPAQSDLEAGLFDPGPPSAGDLAFIHSTPSWLMSGTGQRPPSSSAAQPVAEPAAPASQDHGDWMEALQALDARDWQEAMDTLSPAPNSPPGPDKNLP
jgi:hypothetical protein